MSIIQRKIPTHPTHRSLSSIGPLQIKFCVRPSQSLTRAPHGVMVTGFELVLHVVNEVTSIYFSYPLSGLPLISGLLHILS